METIKGEKETNEETVEETEEGILKEETEKPVEEWTKEETEGTIEEGTEGIIEEKTERTKESGLSLFIIFLYCPCCFLECAIIFAILLYSSSIFWPLL